MFLSLIVPVYNTEEYIESCLQSILRQDIPHSEYEIICVNDGSTDGSLAILRFYELQYRNIRVIDQENGGVCRARNAGLRAAQGNYIWYVDADDFLAENILGHIRNMLQSGQDRLVVGNCDYRENAQTMPVNTAWEDTVVWRNVFRRGFLLENDLLFHYPELTFGEDGLFMYEVKRHSPIKEVFDGVAYFHRNRQGSLSTEMSVETIEKRLKSNIREAEILKNYYENSTVLPEETANRFMSFLWGALYRVSLMPKVESKQYLAEMRNRRLYPYKRPMECTITKCPEVKRNDVVGKMFDILYTNLGSPWGYWGMRLVHYIFKVKQFLRY